MTVSIGPGSDSDIQAAFNAVLPKAGPLSLWGASTTVNAYDAQILVTGGATLPGNPGQGEINHLAGKHIFQAFDGSTQFVVAGQPEAANWWQAVGATAGAAPLLRAVSSGTNCDGLIAAQGHGTLAFGSGEGTILTLPPINAPIVNYLSFTPGAHNQGVTISAEGGDGLGCNITLHANFYGSLIGGNDNGPLYQFNDPVGSNGASRTSWLNFTPGASGVSPVIGLKSVVVTDDALTVSALGAGSLNLQPGGSGDTVVGRGSAGATTDILGHLLIPFVAGAPTGVPTNATHGAALRYDITNHKLWAYDTGTSTWRGSAFT